MTRRSNTSGNQHYDDMIGFLVAFEKKAKTIDVCCNLHPEAINSDGSRSSSASSPHIRYATSIKRSHRGRPRDPVSKRREAGACQNNVENEVLAGEKKQSNGAVGSKGSDHMIITASDVVDLEAKFNEIEDEADFGHSFTSKSNVIPSLPLKQESFYNESVDNLVINSDSSSRIIVLTDPEPFIIGKRDMGKQQSNKSRSNGFYCISNSQKSSETSILKPSSFLTVQQTFGQETKENSKAIAVVFRDPIFEVIPSERGSKESTSCEYSIGDHVEISDRMHGRKNGRIVKTLDDIVQIEVGSVKPVYLYLAPQMLQPLCTRRQL